MAEKKQKETKAIKTAQSQSQQERPKKLYRSRTDRMLGGVCGGFAEYFNMDPTVMRVLWVIAAFLNGLGLLAYIVSWIIIPENPSQTGESTKVESRPKNTGLIWGVILICIGFFFLFKQLDWFDYYPFSRFWHPMWFGFFRFDILLPIIIILIGVVYLLGVIKREKQPENVKRNETSGGKKLEKKLTRSAKDRMIGGVCGGLAKYFNIDPSIVRIGWVLLTLFGWIFLGVVAYIVMLIVIPEESAIETSSPSSKEIAPKSNSK